MALRRVSINASFKYELRTGKRGNGWIQNKLLK